MSICIDFSATIIHYCIFFKELVLPQFWFINVAQANTSTITVTDLSIEWTNNDFISLRVSWDPATAPPGGGGVTYRISYSPVLAIDMITCVRIHEVVTRETNDSSILLTGLDRNFFYSVMVVVTIQLDAPPTCPGKNIHSMHFHANFIMQNT